MKGVMGVLAVSASLVLGGCATGPIEVPTNFPPTPTADSSKAKSDNAYTCFGDRGLRTATLVQTTRFKPIKNHSYGTEVANARLDYNRPDTNFHHTFFGKMYRGVPYINFTADTTFENRPVAMTINRSNTQLVDVNLQGRIRNFGCLRTSATSINKERISAHSTYQSSEPSGGEVAAGVVSDIVFSPEMIALGLGALML